MSAGPAPSSTVERITRTLDAIAASQDDLNAFTHIDDRAVEMAERIDGGTAAESPLRGLPLAVKDLIDHAGRPNTCGSSFPPTFPETTAPAVERLEEAGMVVVGRTGLHEFAFGFSSENHWFGPVRNPWDPSLSPGGSSGGSAAAVAAGLVPVALGTDTGGSVRVPAALCGIVGLKVTHGRIPLRGVFPLAPSLDTVGPLARSTALAEAAYLAMAGDDPADPWSAPRPVTPPLDDLEDLVIGVPHPWVDEPAGGPVAESFAWALETLASSGAEVVHLDLPDLAPPGQIAPSVNFEVAEIHRERFRAAAERYGPDVAERMAAAMETTGAQYFQSLAWRAAMRHHIERSLQRCSVLATPTVAALRKPIGIDQIEVDGRPVHYRTALSRFSALVNHTGLPAIALPLAWDHRPPPSLQLIGRAWNEPLLLAIGHALEQAGIVAVRRPPHWYA